LIADVGEYNFALTNINNKKSEGVSAPSVELYHKASAVERSCIIKQAERESNQVSDMSTIVFKAIRRVMALDPLFTF
jgi:hypothetical protein